MGGYKVGGNLKTKARKSILRRLRALSLVYLSSMLMVLTFQNCSNKGLESSQNGSSVSGNNPTFVTENQVGEEGNTPPVITLSLASTSITEGTDLNVNIEASDTDGTIQKVELYHNGLLIGDKISSPYSFTLSQLNLGDHTLAAKAFDNSGGITTTEAVAFSVTANVVEPTIDPCLAGNGYVPPSLSVPAAAKSISIRIGMQNFSPSDIRNDYERINYNLSGGTNNTYGGVTRNINCNSSKNDLNVDCNGTGIRVRPNGNNNPVECKGGTANITIEVEDSCGGRATGSSTVTYTNVCKSEQLVSATDPENQAIFGSRVSISGNFAAISAPGRGGNNKVGAVYIYQNVGGTWTKTQTLVPSTASYTEVNAVHVNGSKMAIASRATSLNGHTGKIFIYSLSGSTWSLSNTINGPTPTQNPSDITRFGVDVKITSTEVFVGADNEDWVQGLLGGANAGAVYIYDLSGNLKQRLTASNAKSDHNFGNSLDVVGSVLVVGAPMKASKETSSNGGSVSVFTKSGATWSETSVITPSSSKGSAQQFGTSVATNGSNIIVVGASQANDGRGGAYIFSGASWTEKYITAPDRAIRDYYGRSVAISGSTVFVSSPGARHNGDEIGATYFYNSSGNLTFKALPRESSRNIEQNAGSSIAVSNGVLLMGSEASNSGFFNNSGAAYFIGIN